MTSHLFALGNRATRITAVAAVVFTAALIANPTRAHAAGPTSAPVLKQGMGMGVEPSTRVRQMQRALDRRGYSLGAAGVDGRFGPFTAAAVRRFQARRGVVADGIAGPVTRRALGRRGRPPLGRRVLREGMRGWDVAGLQFLLGRAGFPSGTLDGALGPRTGAALRRFQAWSRLGADGLAGPATLARLRGAPPVSPLIFVPPLPIAPTDGFGPDCWARAVVLGCGAALGR